MAADVMYLSLQHQEFEKNQDPVSVEVYYIMQVEPWKKPDLITFYNVKSSL